MYYSDLFLILMPGRPKIWGLLYVGQRGVKELMITAKECCDRAVACDRLAGQTKDPEIKRSYRILVKKYRDYAERLELGDRDQRQAIVRSIGSAMGGA